MTADQFAYWLQGFFEIHSAGEVPLAPFTHKQMAMIQEHLQLVFKKVTGAVTADKLAPTGETKIKPMPSHEEIMKMIQEGMKKNPPLDPGYTPPLPAPWNQPNRPWWDDPYQPQIYCSVGDSLPSGLKIECMDVSKTSDADLDIDLPKAGSRATVTATYSTNAPPGTTAVVNAAPRDPDEPIFIC